MTSSAPSTLPPSFLKEGTLVADRYVLNSCIGQGGMGSVWRATDQVLAVPVALKVVMPSHDDATQVKRFLREARLSAAVQHPNVVRVTDFGTHDGAPFIAMELLEGVSLARRMDQLPRLSVDESVQIVSAVLRGLAAAHDADVVHRDIKPDNVFLVQGPDGMFPKLLDFGISLGVWGGKRVSAVTTEGRVFGTPDYMSPEQARGMPDVDERADVWGVGAMFYEMLCHRTPFLEELPGDLLVAIVRDQPPEPFDLEPDIGEALSGVLMKALEKEPEDRWQTARELRDAIVAASPVPQFMPDVTGPIRIHRGPTAEFEAVREISSKFPTAIPPARGSEDITGEERAIEPKRSPMVWVIFAAVVVLAGVAWAMTNGAEGVAEPEVVSPAVDLDPVAPPEAAEQALPSPPSTAETPPDEPVEDDANLDENPDPDPAPTPTASRDPEPARTTPMASMMRAPRPLMTGSMTMRRTFRELDY